MKSTESDVCYFEVDAVFNREPMELLEESTWTAWLRRTGKQHGRVIPAIVHYCGYDWVECSSVDGIYVGKFFCAGRIHWLPTQCYSWVGNCPPCPLGSRAHEGSVTTCLRRGGIVIQEQIYYRVREKKWKSLNIWWTYGQEFGVLFFCRLP